MMMLEDKGMASKICIQGLAKRAHYQGVGAKKTLLCRGWAGFANETHLLQHLQKAWREGKQRLRAPLGHEAGGRLLLGARRQPEINRIPKHQRWPPLQAYGK